MFVKILTIKNKKIVEVLNLDHSDNLAIHTGIDIKVNALPVIAIQISPVIAQHIGHRFYGEHTVNGFTVVIIGLRPPSFDSLIIAQTLYFVNRFF